MTNKLPVVGKRYRRKHSNREIEVLGFYKKDRVIIDHPDYSCPVEETLSEFFDLFEELPENEAENHWQDMSFAPQDEIILLKTEDEVVKGEWVEYLNAWFTVYENGNNKRIKPVMWKNIEDKAEIKSETQSHISESKEEMKQALDAIRNRRKYLEGYNNGFNDCLKEMAESLPDQISELSPEVKEAMEEIKELLVKIEHSRHSGWVNSSKLFDLEELSKNLLNALYKQFANNKTQAEEVVNNKIEEESIWKPVSELPEESYEEVLIKTDLDNIRRGYFYNDCGKFEVINGYSVETKKYCTLTDFINDYEKLKERVKRLEEHHERAQKANREACDNVVRMWKREAEERQKSENK